MSKNTTIFLCFIFLFSLPFFVFSKDRGEAYYERVKKQYLDLMRSRALQKDIKNWEQVIAGFETVGDAYGESNKAPHGYFMAGEISTDLFRRSGKDKYLERAIINYSKLVQKYRKSSLADDAQLKIADIYRVYKKDNTRAREEYARLVKIFPQGDQRQRAEFWLNKLSEEPSEKDKFNKIVEVSKIDVVSGENYTRVSIELTGETEYTHTILSEDREADKPKRIVLDIKNSKISSNLKEPIPVKDEHLLQIRSSQFDKDTVRVVLDLKSIEEYSTFYFQSPFRIIVDVTGSNYKQTAMDLLLEELGKVENVSEEGSEEIPSVRSEPQEVSEKFHIFIDPGHGGEDPGAIGKHLKLKEKDVTLEVALELKKLFEERGFKVSMSRDKDVFIPLQERTAMANSANADLFISIHANASRRRGAHGIETYFFDLSNDQDVLKLAAMENGIPIQQLNTLQFILTDMERTPIRNQSAMLASSIQENMCTALNTSGVDARNIGVKHGPFYVLKGAKMPAVLVEIAFITNPREERLLASTKYRKKIAQGIMSGVSKYIDNMKTNPIAFLP